MAAADLHTVSADDGGMSPRSERPRRRTFTAGYKLVIVAEYDAAESGEKGAILRREGLYSSHVVEWRRARDAGALASLAEQPGTSKRSPEQAEIDRLKARAERAEAELARTKAALDLVGKAHALLETLSESAGIEPRSKR